MSRARTRRPRPCARSPAISPFSSSRWAFSEPGCWRFRCLPVRRPTPSPRRCGGHAGLGHRPQEAKRFYATIVAGTLVGVGINFVDIDPIKALFWTAVINGIVAVPLMVVMMFMASRRDVMGGFVLPRWLWVFGWLATSRDDRCGGDDVRHLVGVAGHIPPFA